MPANSVREVFLWYPNLIGYVRVLCMAASFYFLWEKEPYRFLAFYMAAFAGDLVDGYVARAFKQESKFGAVLDMVTDRVSTAGMVMCMIPLLKDEHKTFGVSDQKWAVFLVILDIASHWFHVQR
jgi:CDP-diacylglycerol--inositol 3-phosphatidyltransferase